MVTNHDLFGPNTTREQTKPLGDLAQRYRDAVMIDVLHRSQVGACIPFTPLPRQYLGKKVRLVIVGEADE